VPLLVGDLHDRRARPVAGAVDEHVDPSPLGNSAVDEALEIIVRLVRAGDSEPAELARQRLALARGGQDRNPKSVSGEPTRGPCPHTAAACSDECDLLCCHVDPRLLS
jgi:hypothetical protein